MSPSEIRPVLDHDEAARAAAEAVFARFVVELQKGLDTSDADTYDRSFAADVVWGSPYGATLASFDDLNAVHRALMARGTAPPSDFEVVAVRAPAPGVAIGQIRRRARDADGFSEMALYALVERDGRWWLAAAQNTPIAAAPA
ncbi:nuclear transport factor 2 family protein [Frankia sp. AgB32]|uniref:nuclear transport factor 2 family protein n=1 Tax=Frankia sp. AgB32 TaxID=631119 RepID=UPI00200D1F66|nr:nuclear transport factor 2 family protein [Frankia sp. AgB32]MCK9898205.1 nuclear transport factor 2 family protein [Frankia sp. AgB32]